MHCWCSDGPILLRGAPATTQVCQEQLPTLSHKKHFINIMVARRASINTTVCRETCCAAAFLFHAINSTRSNTYHFLGAGTQISTINRESDFTHQKHQKQPFLLGRGGIWFDAIHSTISVLTSRSNENFKPWPEKESRIFLQTYFGADYMRVPLTCQTSREHRLQVSATERVRHQTFRILQGFLYK